MKLPQQRLKLFTPAIAQATAVISSSRATESTETRQTTVFPSSLHSIEQNFYFVQSHVPARSRLALSSWHRISVFQCCQD
jgi:hypothetical protein